MVAEICFTPAGTRDRASGLLGFVRFRAGDLLVDSVAVRRALDGSLTLSFPARRSRAGIEFAYIRPVDEATRREIEAQVLAAIGLGEEAA